MLPAARIAAAIEILNDTIARRRPAADAMKDWGLAHRFAGSGDRAAIAVLVYDALRRKASAAALMGEDSPRAIMLGMLRLTRGETPASLATLFSGAGHAPPILTDTETAALGRDLPNDLPDHVAGDYPEWLAPQFDAIFGAEAVVEGRALATRAPIDLRINQLKGLRAAVQAELAHLAPEATRFSPSGLRIAPRADGRAPSLQSEPAFLKGLFEIQDEGSQLMAELAGPREGEQVLDLCAGGGGKTLECAALMNNRGQIIATDADQRRLAAIHARLERAGVRNVQVRTPRGRADGSGPRATPDLSDLAGRMDLVLIDAPCTGTGTWRRNPDAKWRVRPGALAERQREQSGLLDVAAVAAKTGGRIAYITCSFLPSENDQQIAAFLSRRPDVTIVDPAEVAQAAGLAHLLPASRTLTHGLQLTPARTQTDGFYISLLRRV